MKDVEGSTRRQNAARGEGCWKLGGTTRSWHRSAPTTAGPHRGGRSSTRPPTSGTRRPAVRSSGQVRRSSASRGTGRHLNRWFATRVTDTSQRFWTTRPGDSSDRGLPRVRWVYSRAVVSGPRHSRGRRPGSRRGLWRCPRTCACRQDVLRGLLRTSPGWLARDDDPASGYGRLPDRRHRGASGPRAAVVVGQLTDQPDFSPGTRTASGEGHAGSWPTSARCGA